MNGPPGTFMQTWQGKGYGWGTPNLPAGPLAYATGSASMMGARPDNVPMSPMPTTGTQQPTSQTPLLRTPAPSGAPSANVGGNGGAAGPSSGPSVNIAGSLASVLQGDSMGPGDATTRPGVQSAFELLGKQAPAANAEARMETSDAIMKALTMAVSGEKKAMPSWSGNVSTLRAWLRQLSFWEIDNHIPKQRWGIKLFQALNEGSVPRRIAEGIAMEVILSERGYGAILSAVLEKFKPYLDAAGPAAIDMFFFSGDRQRNESFSNYIAAKELAKQEIENLTGETLPPKLAGRILLKQANLTEQQRETMAIRYNALLSFEEVAAALRPLDRPDALLKPMASTSMATVTLGGSTYWQAEETPMEDQTEKNLEDIPGHEEWDYLPEEDEEAYDEHGEPLLYFEADREYDEDEAVYIWAFNDAYNQILQAWNEEPSSSFPAYQDVRRELQARRKGRQFFRPEAKGRGKGKGKGGRFPGKGKGGRGKSQPRSRKGASKGSADDLLARTRCFSCGELGHFSRDCPNPVPATTSSSAGAHRTTFVVSQGPSKGAINRTFMMTGPNKTVAIYAGVRTAAGEGLVDSAAEDAVIGSGAFQRLKNVLAQQGLQPQPVRGPSGSCAGIGGSARVANLWDVPVGIAKNNGLLRITEVEDCDGFETPFLIPVSFQELVGMVIDYDRAEVRTRQGNSTPMHRLPSGHRSVSVVEFDGKWSLPKELMTQGRDPFQLPRPLKAQTRSAPLGQQKGVAVWLRYSDGSFEQRAWLDGPRKSLVVPSECLPLEIANQLDSSRVTYLDAAPDVDPYIINDVWCHSLGHRELDNPWTGTVIFQQVSQKPNATSSSTASLSPNTTATTPSTPSSRQASSVAASGPRMEVRPAVYNMSDESDVLPASSAEHDFEGVFRSPLVFGGDGDGVQVQHVHTSSPPPWKFLRAKRDRLLYHLFQGAQRLPRSTVFFMNWARDRLRPFSARASEHAAAHSFACARRRRGSPAESCSPPQGCDLVREVMGQSRDDLGPNDSHGPPAAGGGLANPGRLRTFGLGFFFYDGTSKEQAEQEERGESQAGAGHSTLSKPGTDKVDAGTRELPPRGAGPADARKSSPPLVGMSQVWQPLGKSGDGHGGESSRTTKSYAARVSSHEPSKDAASTEIASQPRQPHLGSGQVATDEAYADNVDYPGEPLDYTTREADTKNEDRGRVQGHAQEGHSGVLGGHVPRGAPVPVRAGQPERRKHVHFGSQPGAGNFGGPDAHPGPGQHSGSPGSPRRSSRMGRLRADTGPHGDASPPIEELTSRSTSCPGLEQTPTSPTDTSRPGGVCYPREPQRRGQGQGCDAGLVQHGESQPRRPVSSRPAEKAHGCTTTEPPQQGSIFSMLKSAPLHVQQNFAKRGYGLACGLAVLLSSFGTTPPLASSSTSSLPFRRLEAGVVQGGGDLESYSFVLFQMPDETFEFEVAGSLGRPCTLPRPARNFVIESLESLQKEASTFSTTTLDSIQIGFPGDKGPTTSSTRRFPQLASEPKQPQQPQSADHGRSGVDCSTQSASEPRQPQQPQSAVHGRSEQPRVQVYKKGRYQAVSRPIVEQRATGSELSDGGLQRHGPFGTRVLCFLCAWSFYHGVETERILGAVVNHRPALVVGRIESSSRAVLVRAGALQDNQGGMFALMCDRRASPGLCRQLPSATSVLFSDGKHAVAVLVNDKTLVRAFTNLKWDQQTWPDTETLESLEVSVVAFLQVLCHPDSLSAVAHANMDIVRKLVAQIRPVFEGLLTASRTFLASEVLSETSSVSSFRRCGGSPSTSAPSFSTSSWPKSRFQSRFCRAFPTARTEDEAQAEAFDQDEIEADEALEEVRQSLRPVTESNKVAEALKNVDDFRRHEEFGKFSLHPQLRREIFKVHRNLNHPSKEVFLRALKHAGTKDEIIAWVKEHFSCPLCESARRPMAARPAHLARCLTFNSVIAIDLFYLNLFGAEKIFLVCVDHGTGYVQVARCRDAKAVTVRQELCRAWVQPFGVPELILCDQGPEFMGSQFQEHMSQLGAAVHYTDGASPWQNGKAERTVQTLKNKILLTIKDITAHEEELDVVIAHVVSAYNSMYDRHGFTPDQRVFGRSVRMPASLLADDRLNQELLMESAGDAVQRSWDISSAARQAWLKKDDAEAVRRARRVQTRATDVHSYTLQPGQWVYVWRRSEHRHGWTGPGALIAQVPGGTSWWINVRGRLWKAPAEQIRPAADEEDLGASLMIELHRDLTKQLKEGRQVTFQDITDEGGPQDPAEDDLSELFDLDRRSNPREESNETVEEVEPGTPSLGGTTTVGEEQSLAPGSSAPQDSRRQSVSSAPVLPEEETQEAPGALDSGGRDLRRIIKVDEGSSGTMSFGPVPSQISTVLRPDDTDKSVELPGRYGL